MSSTDQDAVERVRIAIEGVDTEALRERKRAREQWARDHAQRFRRRRRKHAQVDLPIDDGGDR